MNLCLLLGEQDAVPRRPLLRRPPAHQTQVGQHTVATEDGLAAPKVLHHVADIGILQDKDKCTGWGKKVTQLLSMAPRAVGQ